MVSTSKIINKAVYFCNRLSEKFLCLWGNWEFSSGIKIPKRYFPPFELYRYRELKLRKLNFWEPVEEDLFCGILKKYDHKGIFIDVGAAVGYYCFLARKISPDIEIHAFNPDPKFIKMMRKTMKLNGVFDICIHSQAISDTCGRCDISRGFL